MNSVNSESSIITLNLPIWELDYDAMVEGTCPKWVKELMKEDSWFYDKNHEAFFLPGYYGCLCSSYPNDYALGFYKGKTNNARAICILGGRVTIITDTMWDSIRACVQRI